MDYQYKVVPFIGQSRGQLSAADVARQLESTISQHVSDGWEFYQLSDVNIEIQPGCLSGIFGAKVQYVRFDQLIFRSARNAELLSSLSTRDVREGTRGGSSLPVGTLADRSPYPTTALEQALQGLDSPDPVIRERSASALGDLGAAAAGALGKLEVLKSDPVLRVRGRAAWAIEEIMRKQRLASRSRT